MPKEKALDPSIIDTAPVTAGSQDSGPAEDNTYLRVISELSARLEEAEAENEALKGKETFDDVRTHLLTPVVTNVIRFVICYCVAAGCILIGSGFGHDVFHLSDTILGIIAGSTAVSVIGLIGMVIGGLFGASKTNP